MIRVSTNRHDGVVGVMCALALALALALTLALTASARAQTQPHTFRSLVDTTGGFSDFHDQAINDVGGIVFNGFLDNGSHGVFTGPDPVADALYVDDNNTTPLIVGNVITPALNNAGTLLFTAGHRFGGGAGIYRGPSRTTDAFVNTDGPYSGLGAPALTNAGPVVFTGRLGLGRTVHRSQSGTDAVVTSAGPFRFFSFSRPGINQAGALAFRGQLDDGTIGIFTGPDPVADAVATTANGFSRFFNSGVGSTARGGWCS
jgi:hypothetical protein